MSSGKIHFLWNGFKKNISDFYESAPNYQAFNNVTLVCEDNYQLEANKILLSSTSLCFRTILSNTTHSHPIIFLRGVGKNSLESIINYIYKGEVRILQDDLQSFLSLGEDLEILGLLDSFNSENLGKDCEAQEYLKEENKEEESYNKTEIAPPNVGEFDHPEIVKDDSVSQEKYNLSEEAHSKYTEYINKYFSLHKDEESDKQFYKCTIDGVKILPIDKSLKNHWRKYHSEDPDDKMFAVTEETRDAVIEALVIKNATIDRWECKICGYVGNRYGRSAIMVHIESRHISGDSSYKCKICDKAGIPEQIISARGGRPRVSHFKTRESFRNHMMTRHRDLKPINDVMKKPNKCRECALHFKTRESLRTHRRTEQHDLKLITDSRRKPKECKKCPSHFKTRESLRSHMRAGHHDLKLSTEY